MFASVAFSLVPLFLIFFFSPVLFSLGDFLARLFDLLLIFWWPIFDSLGALFSPSAFLASLEFSRGGVDISIARVLSFALSGH